MVEISIEIVQHEVLGHDQRITPTLKFQIWLGNKTRGNFSNLKLLLTSVELKVFGQSISVSSPSIRNENFSGQVMIVEEIPFPKYLLQSIEQKRTDDLPLRLSIGGLVSYTQDNNPTTIFDKFTSDYNFKQSQKEWTTILEKMGFKEAWIIEITRPKIEGFDVVKEHLQKASEAIDRRDFEKAISDCRVAWDSLSPLISSSWEKIANEIDLGSPGEPDYPKKSERIKKLREATLLWSQIGVHREAYRVTPEDAFLCYHTTVTLVSFLSSLLAKSMSKEQE
jgi:hypothetical protein